MKNEQLNWLHAKQVLQRLEAALAMGCYGLTGPVDEVEVGKCLHRLGMDFMDIRDSAVRRSCPSSLLAKRKIQV